MNARIKHLTLATVATLGLLLSPVLASPPADAAPIAGATQGPITLSPQSARPLTIEEMQAARALPEPVLPRRGSLSPRSAAPTGAPGFQPGSRPSTLAPSAIDTTRQQRLSYPYVTTGKLFFNAPGDKPGEYHACSASAMGRNVIWTAGHCVFTPGVGWHSNYRFVPALELRRGALTMIDYAPFGQWTAREHWASTSWANNTGTDTSKWDMSRDYGAVVLSPGGTQNKSLGDVVGYLGFAWNQPFGSTFDALGYPALPTPRFNGSTMEECKGPAVAQDQGSPAPIGLSCDMRQGASGGPWIIDNGYLNGDFSYERSGAEIYGPYFDTEVLNFKNLVAGRFP